ncbi:MAG: metal ABC transporter permease [Gammaproteobacteria bacterium PRO9]|nr:metal ABC transporter permease [Gammaproteobacteria bacterium PRO9]
MNTSTLELSILGPAFVAGLLVLATHVPLGIEVLRRGIIFIDLAIAQMAGLGALAGSLYLPGAMDGGNTMAVQACSLVAALGGAVLLTWTERRLPEIQEALIGCLFVLSASLSLLLVGENPHGSEHIKDLLAGQILWVLWPHIRVVAALYAVLLVCWFAFRERLGRAGFYVIFALAVTASVQLVGVYLVFSSLIMPALALRRWSGGRQLAAAWFTGAVGLAAGLVLSALFDLSTGPTMVATLASSALIAGVVTSRRAPDRVSGEPANRTRMSPATVHGARLIGDD